MYIGTFYPPTNPLATARDAFNQFQYDVESAVKELTRNGVTKLIVDLHNNPGMYSVGSRFTRP